VSNKRQSVTPQHLKTRPKSRLNLRNSPQPTKKTKKSLQFKKEKSTDTSIQSIVDVEESDSEKIDDEEIKATDEDYETDTSITTSTEKTEQSDS
jgi:hypothetical protein